MRFSSSAPLLPRWLPRLPLLARAQEWWEYKLAPLLATAYATALLVGLPLPSLLPGLAWLLASLIVGATYVSLLNDVTDRADDAAAGKPNRLAQASPGLMRVLFGGCLASGLAFGVLAYWWYSGWAAAWYAGAWLAYTLYSLPPFRWKTRGTLGLLADAAGAHFFPQLYTVALVGAWAGTRVPLAWLLLVGTWALACGLRNILWHQLHDADADAHTHTATFVYRYGAATARQLATRVLFPLEVAAFGLLLLWLHNPLAWAGLLLYGGLVWFRYRQWGVVPVVVAPRASYHLWLNEYYEALYPLALLLTAVVAPWPPQPAMLGLLLGHLGLFSRRLRQTGYTLWTALLALGLGVRKRLRSGS